MENSLSAKEMRKRAKNFSPDTKCIQAEWSDIFDRITYAAEQGKIQVEIYKPRGVYRKNWKNLKKLGYKVRYLWTDPDILKISW